jgi:hypothetical protein
LRRLSGVSIILSILSPLIVNVFKIECMNMSRKITQQCKKNVDTEINSTARNQKDSKWWDEDLSELAWKKITEKVQ